MEFRQLQTFVTIAQFLSFSRAAEHLGYSQSAVTVQIRQLEDELNVKLFDRIAKQVTLTTHGFQFLEYANSIIQQANQAKYLIRPQTELHHNLHIGTLESLCFSKFPNILFYFRREHPKVPIQITTAPPKELFRMLENNQLDIIYILDRARYSENWNKVLEKQEPIVFIVPANSQLALKQEVAIEELLDTPFFLTEKNENYRRELDYFLESKGIALTPFIESSSVEFIIRMLKENNGISYLPKFSVQKSIEEGDLVILNVPELQKSLFNQIFYHKNKWCTPEMEEFIRLASLNLFS